MAVAQKLAVLLHRLWITGEVYDPPYQQKQPTVDETGKPDDEDQLRESTHARPVA